MGERRSVCCFVPPVGTGDLSVLLYHREEEEQYLVDTVTHTHRTIAGHAGARGEQASSSSEGAGPSGCIWLPRGPWRLSTRSPLTHMC